MHPSQNILQNLHETKNIKPGLVTSYDRRPGNKEGLFSALHKFVTYLLTQTMTHLLTALCPKRGNKQWSNKTNTRKKCHCNQSRFCQYL